MAKSLKEAKERAKILAGLIAHHQKRYHEEDAPEITDETYDSLVRELSVLVNRYPVLAAMQKTLDAVGGRPSDAFKKVQHKVRQWSFDNVFNDEELHAWEDRLYRSLEKQDIAVSQIAYVSAHKID